MRFEPRTGDRCVIRSAEPDRATGRAFVLLNGVTKTTTSRQDELVARLAEAAVGALELFSVHLGLRLGLYRALAGHGAATSKELAGRAGIDERYAQEWLEQQAVAGFLEVAGGADAATRQYVLPPEHAGVLVDPDDPAHVAPFSSLIAGIGGVLTDVVDAYRTGAGVPYQRYGVDFREGQGAINRPSYLHELAGWVRSVPWLHERLSAADRTAKIADLGCGQGHSTRALATAYPDAIVVGVDSDEGSIADAMKLSAAMAGERLSFEIRDAAHLAETGPYDLICMFEALHDLARPVEVLAAARAALAERGAMLIADERVAEYFVAPGDLVERLMYGWSVSHCLPASRAEEGSAALGTVLRPDTVRRLATEAGFTTVEILPIENDFFRFYLLRTA